MTILRAIAKKELQKTHRRTKSDQFLTFGEVTVGVQQPLVQSPGQAVCLPLGDELQSTADSPP